MSIKYLLGLVLIQIYYPYYNYPVSTTLHSITSTFSLLFIFVFVCLKIVILILR